MNDATQMLIELQKQFPEDFAASEAAVAFVQETAAKLQFIRESVGFSRPELARRLAISPERVADVESGALRHAPSLQLVAHWTYVCGTRVQITSL